MFSCSVNVHHLFLFTPFFLPQLPVLKEIADKSDFKMLLDPAVLEMILIAGNPEFRIAPLRIRHDPAITPISPYEHIFLK